jgi:[ribosomal protein S5]-alanine N-acetyltransferase
MTEGESLVKLRPVVLDDAALIFESWGRRAENFTYLTAHVFADVNDAQRYIADLFPTRQSLAFHIVTSSEGVVGIIKASVVGHRAQVGYVLDKTFWGRGLATSALRQLLVTLEANSTLSRIWATCALDNPASARVLEKSGFTREAILKNWVTYPARGGQAFDNYSYVRLPRSAG